MTSMRVCTARIWVVVALAFLLFPWVGTHAQEGGLGFPEITTIAFSPAGEYIAYAGGPFGCVSPEVLDADRSPYAIRILDTVTLEVVTTLTGHLCQVTTVAWSADGTRLASSSEDGATLVWDIVTEARGPRSVASFGAGKSGAVWSADGRWIADFDLRGGGVRVWKTLDGTILTYLNTSERSRTMAITLNPEGTLLAQATSDGATHLWDVSDLTSGGEGVLVATYADRPAASLVWSPDGQQLVLGGMDILIIDSVTGDILTTLAGHERVVTTLAWNPIYNLLASGDLDGIIHIWNLRTSEIVASFEHDLGAVWAVAWYPDGARLAYGGGGETFHTVALDVADLSADPTPAP